MKYNVAIASANGVCPDGCTRSAAEAEALWREHDRRHLAVADMARGPRVDFGMAALLLPSPAIDRTGLGDAVEVLENHFKKTTNGRVHVLGEERVAQIIREGKPGWYGDGGGLYIQIPVQTARSYWFFIAGDGRRRCVMSLGPTHFTTLAQAREAADACWRLWRAGLDPRVERARIRRRNCNVEFAPEWESYREFCRRMGQL